MSPIWISPTCGSGSVTAAPNGPDRWTEHRSAGHGATWRMRCWRPWPPRCPRHSKSFFFVSHKSPTGRDWTVSECFMGCAPWRPRKTLISHTIHHRFITIQSPYHMLFCGFCCRNVMVLTPPKDRRTCPKLPVTFSQHRVYYCSCCYVSGTP